MERRDCHRTEIIKALGALDEQYQKLQGLRSGANLMELRDVLLELQRRFVAAKTLVLEMEEMAESGDQKSKELMAELHLLIHEEFRKVELGILWMLEVFEEGVELAALNNLPRA